MTADLHNCRGDPVWMLDAEKLGAWCLQAVTASGLQAVNQLFHTCAVTGHGPGGISVTVLLAGSHVCVHTWPGQKAVTLDVYVCNLGGDHSARAHALLQSLTDRFVPEWTEQRSLDRGDES